MSKKISSERFATKYHNEIISGTIIYKTYFQRVIVDVDEIISNKKDIPLVTERCDKKFKNIRLTSKIKREIIIKDIFKIDTKFSINIFIFNKYNAKSFFMDDAIEFSNILKRLKKFNKSFTFSMSH